MRRILLPTVVALALIAPGCSEGNRTTVTGKTAVRPVPTGSSVSTHPARPEVSATASSSTPAGALTRVADRSQVCMVNNQFMGRAQIPVEVGGRTYYGCCEMCKGRLNRDISARTATDPVSNRSVDKSQAVIAQDERGAVTYFETEANFVAYTQRIKRK